MIRPTRGKILGEVIKPEEKIGSIYVVVKKRDIPERLKILAVGLPGRNKKGKEIKPYVESGSVAYIKRQAGERFKYDGKDFVVVTNEDITGRC